LYVEALSMLNAVAIFKVSEREAECVAQRVGVRVVMQSTVLTSMGRDHVLKEDVSRKECEIRVYTHYFSHHG
jgi:hypothetical protein